MLLPATRIFLLIKKINELLWIHCPFGSLALKEAYLHVNPSLIWPKIIWNLSIPFKFFLVWRMMHNKIPCDSNMKLRGCCLPSICSICKTHDDSTYHIFFTCNLAAAIWAWFINLFNVAFLPIYPLALWLPVDPSWSPQCLLVINDTIINIINAIWFYKNQSCFSKTPSNLVVAKNRILMNYSILGNHTSLASSPSIIDFVMLKAFQIKVHLPKAFILKEIIWKLPLSSWVKCNTNGDVIGCLGLAFLRVFLGITWVVS